MPETIYQPDPILEQIRDAMLELLFFGNRVASPPFDTKTQDRDWQEMHRARGDVTRAIFRGWKERPDLITQDWAMGCERAASDAYDSAAAGKWGTAGVKRLSEAVEELRIWTLFAELSSEVGLQAVENGAAGQGRRGRPSTMDRDKSWLARTEKGESQANIAREAGVQKSTVSKAIARAKRLKKPSK